ncbi:MAG: phosphoglycerate kinase [Clostridia bacterium]|nr:phosphoglycerate kinase [Clostridia bacterium]
MNKRTFKDIDVAGKRVLVRVDYNVPFNEDGEISDDTRIRGTIPTLNYLLKQKAKIILCSHLGRPKGMQNPKFSLAPVAKRLSNILGVPVKMAKDAVGESAKTLVGEMQPGDIVMLENVRFYAQEEENDDDFAKELASLADVFVNDAFGTAHRAHASTAGVAKYLPSVAGFLMSSEIMALGDYVENAEKPFVLILGGAKVTDKIGVISALLPKVNTVLIGGAMANTFIACNGGKLGYSRFEKDKLEVAKKILDEAERLNVKVLLPIDVVASTEFAENAPCKRMKADDIRDGYQAMDIGPKTCRLFAKEIKHAKTIVWNGPMGVFEFKKFQKGTRAVAKAVAKANCVSIVGGGDSASAINSMGYAGKITHISTGGGASLKFLEGANLPGISMLLDKDK